MCVILAVINKNSLGYDNLMGILKQTVFNAFFHRHTAVPDNGRHRPFGGRQLSALRLRHGTLSKASMANDLLMLLICILAGAAVGCVNGLLLTRLHLSPFLSTLDMKNVLWSLALVVTNSQMINNFPRSVQWLGKTTIYGFPVMFIAVIALYVIMHIFLSRSAFGRSVYCTGGNIEATRLSGIDTSKCLLLLYALRRDGCPSGHSFGWALWYMQPEPTPYSPMIPMRQPPA